MTQPTYKELLERIEELEKVEAERKQVERTLRESEKSLRSLKDNINVGIYRSTPGPEGKYLEVNPAMVKIFGYSSTEEFLQIKPADLYVNPGDRLAFSRKVSESMVVLNEEYEMKKKDGTHLILTTSVQAVKDQKGNIIYFDGIVEDITVQKQVQEELETQIHFLETLEDINDIIRKGSDLEQTMNELLKILLTVLLCDRAFLVYPCDPDAPTIKVPMEQSKPEFPGALSIGKEIINDSELSYIERMMLNADGPFISDITSGGLLPEVTKKFSAQSMISMVIYPKLSKPWILGLHQCSHPRIWTNDDQFLFNEIGHRLTDSLSSLLFMQNLQQSEERFRELFANIKSGVAVYEAIDNGRDFKFKDFNKAGEQIESTKKEDVIGKRITEIFPGVIEMGLVETMRKVLETGHPVHHPASFYKDQRISGWRENYVYKLSTGEIVCVYNDITEHKNAEDEKKKLQEQLFQAQKMESIGRLAGSIAHDFNNILTGLMGFAELLQFKNPDISTREGKAADSILKGTERAASLTRQLLGFARGGKSEFKSLNLNEIIRDTIRLSENLFEKSIRIKMTFTENLLNIEADRNQLDQMLTNLIINARDAMPRGGELQLKTENVLIKLDFAKIIPGVKPGHYVKFTISDTGIGMSKEVQEKIFEPFFTTKAEGVGTGLGLATVYGIIKNHKGHIEVNSQPGMGATFSVYFPGSDKPRQDEQAKGTIVSGEEAILVVDDEEGVRESVKLALEGFGYKVFSAANGIDAINLYKKNKGDIDLVLLDMIMPNMAGRETFFELKKLDSGVKVVLFSGYSKNEQAAEIINQGALDFLQKPYRLHDLIDSIRKALKK